jgi:aminopeptidase YwaD
MSIVIYQFGLRRVFLFLPLMKIKYKLLSFLILIGQFSLFAQDLEYARKVIDDLTAENMHGRGYVQDGDEIAAFYIKEQMENLGVLAFDYNFYQDFTMKVNTFPNDMSAKVDGKALVPGEDFLVSPPSGRASGTYELLWFDLKIMTDTAWAAKFDSIPKRNKIIVLDPEQAANEEQKKWFQALQQNPFQAKGVITLKDKLTWGVSQSQYPFVMLEILRESLPKDASEISLKIDAQLKSKHRSQNIIGFIEGKEYPDSFIVFSAHYDHLGRMGKDAYFPGANDNASGIAMLLNLAFHYGKTENRPDYSIAFIAFGAEEAGLVGSEYYVQNPVFPLEEIKFLLNLDLLGTGEDGITVVNATKHMDSYYKLVEINEKKDYLKKVKKRGPAANSDHYHFAERGVPAFFIYTLGGIAAYHDIYDRAETLPLTEFEDVFRLLSDFVAGMGKSKDGE